MLTTAHQAFLFCADKLRGAPESEYWASIFRLFADLCQSLPGDPPGPLSVAHALEVLGAGETGDVEEDRRRAAWLALAEQLREAAPFKSALDTPTASDAMREWLKDLASTVAPSVRLAELHEAIWLWQQLADAAEARVSNFPRLVQNQKTGQVAIERNGLLIALPPIDVQRLQQEMQFTTSVYAGLRMDLRTLIERLRPVRPQTDDLPAAPAPV